MRAVATTLLARRDYAGGELAAKLISKGYPRGEVAAEIERLVDERVIDDGRYAANFVAYRAGRGQGPVRIRQELRGFGLGDELIATALDGGTDWATIAREVRRRRFGAAVPADYADKSRQARFLQYRGFSSDHIRAALGRDFDPDQ